MTDQHADSDWMVEILGQTVGPLPLARVVSMIATRTLLPTDRICRVGSIQWQLVSRVIEELKSRGQWEDGNTPLPHAGPAEDLDELERLIFDVLSAPSAPKENPNLAELGLIRRPQTAVKDEQSDRETCESTIPSKALSATGTRWSLLNPRRMFAQSAQSATPLASPPEDDHGASFLPQIARNFTEQRPGDKRRSRPGLRKPSWLEILIAFATFIFLAQLFPAIPSLLWHIVDARRWTWSNWVTVEILVIVVFGGIAIWKRR